MLISKLDLGHPSLININHYVGKFNVFYLFKNVLSTSFPLLFSVFNLKIIQVEYFNRANGNGNS